MTTKAKATGHKPLTLLNGAKVVTFRHMNVRDHMKRESEVERQRLLTLAAYPDLKKLYGTPAFEDHPDFPDYAGQLGVRMEHAPWLLAACNEPLTVDDILNSDYDELLACGAAVRRLNQSSAVYFPRAVQIHDETTKPESADPN